MTDRTDIVRAALKQAQSKWSTTFGLLGGVMLALTIDYYNGLPFLHGTAEIKALGLTLTRATFSIIYMLVFAVLILGHASSARIVRTVCEELVDPASREAVARSAEVRLWTLSPLNTMPAMRVVFWAIAAFGLVVLAVVTMAHLMMYHAPPEDQALQARDFRIGLYCAATLAGSMWLAVTRIYPDWERIRAILGPHADDHG